MSNELNGKFLSVRGIWSLTVLGLLTTPLWAQPVIISQPQNQTVLLGSNATFTVIATNAGPWTCQWQFDGTNLPNDIITTVAGNGGPGNFGDGGSALIASLVAPQAVSLDASGNVLVADSGSDSIRKVETNGTIIRLAGIGYINGTYLPSGTADSVSLDNPASVIEDSSGDLIIADKLNNRICKVDTSGHLTTIAGNGTANYSGDQGPASSAQLSQPSGLAMDAAGDIFIADSGNWRIREIDTNGIITTVAGDGAQGDEGDGGPATNAELLDPQAVAVDSAGNLYIADNDSNYPASVIRKVDTNGIITTVAGDPQSDLWGYTGDNVAATNTTLYEAEGIMVDSAGNLFIADSGNNRVRKVDTNGIITTVAGNGISGPASGDGGQATSATVGFPTGVAEDAAGDLFIAANGNNEIREVNTNGVITTLAGNGSTAYTGDGGPATNARFGDPIGVALDPSDNLFVADKTYQRIRKVGIDQGISTIAGTGTAGYSGDDGPAVDAKLSNPGDVALDAAGNLFIADTENNCVRKINTAGIIKTIAGNGTPGFSGDGLAATNASLKSPVGVAVDNLGNLYIADQGNDRIRKVDTNGIISTVAGDGFFPPPGDGGLATNAGLSAYAVAVDASGNIYIADELNNRIRRVDTNGIITTVAGTNSVGPEFSGDGGPAIFCHLGGPDGVAVDSEGTLYITDAGNDRIRMVGTNGIINTVAGNGSAGYSGDGGAATNAGLCPAGIALDAAGNLFIADAGNYRVRKVSFSDKPSLTLINVDPDNLGAYRVIVTGASGSVTSSVVNLQLLLPPMTSRLTGDGNVLALTWASISNEIYQIQYKTNLATGSWQDLGSPVTATGSTITISNSVGPDVQRYYRAQLIQ